MKKINIGKYIAAIHRNTQVIIDHNLKEYDIRSGQHDFLYVIGNNEGLSQKELSEILKVGKATTAKAVKNLLENGYIMRQKNLDDKRYYELYLTQKGKDIKPIIDSIFDDMLEIYSKGFSQEEYSKIVDSLSRIFKNVIQESENKQRP